MALDKAWTDYYNLSKEQEPDKKRIMHYERVIHNFERKFGRPRTLFSIYKMLAWAFCWYNPELFREGVTEALVKKGMMKTGAIVESRMPLDERPNIVQDRIRSYREVDDNVSTFSYNIMQFLAVENNKTNGMRRVITLKAYVAYALLLYIMDICS